MVDDRLFMWLYGAFVVLVVIPACGWAMADSIAQLFWHRFLWPLP